MAQKARYSWWAYIKEIVQAYPEKKSYGLHGVEMREYEAVRDAVEFTEQMTSAENRMEVIKLVHFDRTHTLAGAALTIPCDRATAARWQRQFFEEVARNRGILD